MRKLLDIIAIVRADPAALDGYSYLSTSEWLVVCLGVATPAAIARLEDGRYPTIPEAWARIGSSGREIVQEAWERAAMEGV